MKSTKKKKSPLVEDFINSLMDDVKEEATSIENKTQSVAGPLGPIGVGLQKTKTFQKNKTSVRLATESDDPYTQTKKQEEKTQQTATHTFLPGVDLYASPQPVVLEKIDVKKQKDGFFEVQVHSQKAEKAEKAEPSNDEEVTQLSEVAEPVAVRDSSPEVLVYEEPDENKEFGVFGLDESVVQPMTVNKSVSLKVDEIPELSEDEFAEPKDVNQFSIDLDEKNNSLVQDDATVPLGAEPEERSLAMDKTIPPDPQTYRGRDYSEEPNKWGSSQRSSEAIANSRMSDEYAQTEHLRMAQQRIFQLEKENDVLRSENDELANAAEIIKNRIEEQASKISKLEEESKEERESFQSEVYILKGNLQHKENENIKLKLKIEDLEARLRTDFRKIRVRERELENRLELLKAEKLALVRAKDENILELRRKLDTLQNEIESYRAKLLELNQIIDSNQDQFKRTVKALRLALSNLEIKDENVVPLKKAD